jgi:DNA-binding protein H-NS
MQNLNFDTMDLEELWELHEQLTRFLSAKIIAEKLELERRFALLTGNDPNASAELESGKRKYPKVVPKYCNPSVPSERWSGRGKKPRWLAAALNAGRTLEEFRVPDPNALRSKS